MAEPPDLDALARRYVELWQDQWTALATDPEAAQAMTRLAELFAAPAAAVFGTALAASPGPDLDRSAPGAAAARPASGGGDGRLDELARRIAAVEERLARLEAAAAPRRARAGARRRRS